MVDLNSIRAEMARSELLRAVDLAQLRCLSTLRLLRDLPNLLNRESRDAALFVLRERRLSGAEQRRLAAILLQIANRSKDLPPRERAKADSAVRQLIRTLPARIAAPLAEEFLDAKWKSRRMIAYSGLRVTGVTMTVARRLLARYRKTRDQHLLEIIVRSPRIVARLESQFMLEELSERYWRARVMEALIRHSPAAAFRMANAYPKEFAHGAGRAQDPKSVPVLKRLMKSQPLDSEFLSLCAYAFGRIGARGPLRQLRELGDKIPTR